MRARQFVLLIAGATLFAGCDKDTSAILAPNVSAAFTRFVNAVPDTGATDWRFVDQLEYSPFALGVNFRGFSPYQQALAGERRLRVFPTSDNINITSAFLIDTVLTLTAGRYYTIVHTGYSRPGQTPADRIIVIEDDIPAIATDKFAIRAMNLGAGLGNADFYVTATTTSALPASATFANVAYGAATAYTPLDTGTAAVRAFTSGTTTPAMATASAPAGVAGSATLNTSTIGGSRMGGSGMVAILMPRSVAGSSAPQTTAFTSPAVVYIIDKHPR